MRDILKSRKHNQKYRKNHKDDEKERKRRWRQSEKGKISVRNQLKNYRENNKDKIHNYKINHYQDTREESINSVKESRKKRLSKLSQEELSELKKKEAQGRIQSYKKVKDKFLDMYGRTCVCCKESNEGFLTLEHKNGQKGNKKKEYGATSYRRASKEYRPDLYEILCYNCNCAKGHLGYCPHNVMPEHTSP